MDFDKPKVYGDTFISDGLVSIFLAGKKVVLLKASPWSSYLGDRCAVVSRGSGRSSGNDLEESGDKDNDGDDVTVMIITVFVKVMMTTNHIHSKLGDDLGGLKGVELLVPEKIKT